VVQDMDRVEPLVCPAGPPRRRRRRADEGGPEGRRLTGRMIVIGAICDREANNRHAMNTT